jgi:hypothetical protein
MGAASADLTVIACYSHRDTGRWFGSAGTSVGFSRGGGAQVMLCSVVTSVRFSGLQGAQAQRGARVGGVEGCSCGRGHGDAGVDAHSAII